MRGQPAHTRQVEASASTSSNNGNAARVEAIEVRLSVFSSVAFPFGLAPVRYIAFPWVCGLASYSCRPCTPAIRRWLVSGT